MAHKPPKPDLRCGACKDDKCHECMDLFRVSCRLEPCCPCQRKQHQTKVQDARDEELDNEDDELMLDYEPLEPLEIT